MTKAGRVHREDEAIAVEVAGPEKEQPHRDIIPSLVPFRDGDAIRHDVGRSIFLRALVATFAGVANNIAEGTEFGFRNGNEVDR